MGSQRQSSLDVHLLASPWFLSSMLLAAAAALPILSRDSLLCNYCPLQHKGDSCSNLTTQCLPHQRCSSSRGRFGSIHILSAQGCLDAELCDSHELVSYRGVPFNVSHTCCCEDKCNIQTKPQTRLKILLGILTQHYQHTNASQEEPSDSCANYTSSGNLSQ